MLCTVSLFVLFGVMFSVFAVSTIEVGVTEGDLIEYQVSYSGDVPEAHDVTWAKIEVTKVESTQIEVAVTSRYSDGTEETVTTNLNLLTGQIADCFIIPANLKEGDTFLEQVEGTITITGVQEKTYAGAKRVVVTAKTTHTEFVWDQATGFLVDATSTYPDFSLDTTAEKTNIWHAQAFGVDPFWSFILVVLAIVATVAIVLKQRYRKRR